MKRIVLTCSSCFIYLMVYSQAGKKPDPQVDVKHYEFNIMLSDTSDVIICKALIDIDFRGMTEILSLDLRSQKAGGRGMSVSSLTLNGSEIEWTHSDDKLTVKPALAFEGHTSGQVEVNYSGIPSDGLIISRNKFGNRTFFADHWPDRASYYLPVVDHPADKASADFIITAPEHFEVVGGGILVEESDLAGGMKLTHWKEEVPLPVKVMTFGAADFAVQLAGTVDNVPVWTWVYPENRKEGFHDYAVAVKPLRFYSELIGPYPYLKLANVQSKTIFGGLENAGCIFYSEGSVTGEGRAESLIAHEIAHQWFGNSVTEGDWHHIWLSEGFATYLTSVYMEMTYGRENLTESMKSARDRVLRFSRRLQKPVIDSTVVSLMDLLNPNSYQKGAWVLHMLRSEMGEEDFWKGMRLYYQSYRNRNALTADFRHIMEEAGGKDLGAFFKQWLEVAGEPELKVSVVEAGKKGTPEIVIEQMQDHIFTFNLELLIRNQKGERLMKIPVSERKTSVRLDGGRDTEIITDPNIRLLYRAAD
ncbi:MAG TPA: M1 family metallopeptidase [Bacteroidales bacterium]|nr:M1 family metallopeptidase [Bacteroidales bacterium]